VSDVSSRPGDACRPFDGGRPPNCPPTRRAEFPVAGATQFASANLAAPQDRSVLRGHYLGDISLTPTGFLFTAFVSGRSRENKHDINEFVVSLPTLG